MASTTELIKERLGIAEVVGSYIKLEKAGMNLKARCPFHNEKTPSFMVSPTRGGFYCFGCGEKGDMFSFVEKFEGVDFKGALKILAERAGVPLTFEKGESKSEKDRLYSVLEETTRFFEKNLVENKKALAYLNERGLTEKTIKEFRIGYASIEWRDLLTHLRKKKFEDSLIEKVGLIKKSEEAKGKDYYDRFRGRIMFPIADTSGRIVAFSGRIFEKPEKEGSVEPAKYINSPETSLFSKSKILYGYDKAKDGIRKWGFTILVEGQMDLVMSHQGGFRNTVALSGTALSREHVALLGRLSDKLVLALDDDDAGVKASLKSAELTLSKGMDVKVARVEEGKDPADLIKGDPELWRKAIREAKSIIDFYVDNLNRKHTDRNKLRLAVSKEVVPYIAKMPSMTDRDNKIRDVALRIHQSEANLTEEVRLFIKNQGNFGEAETNEEEKSSGTSRKDKILRQLLGAIVSETTYKKGKFRREETEKILTELLGAQEFAKELERANLTPDVLFEGEAFYEKEGAIDLEIEELLLNLKYYSLKELFEELMYELKEKEKSGLVKEATELLQKCHDLSREMAKIDILLKK